MLDTGTQSESSGCPSSSSASNTGACARSTSSALWDEVWSSLRLDDELRPFVDRSYRAWIDRLVALIEQGRGDGSISESVRAAESGWHLAAVADGVDSMLYLGLIGRRPCRRRLVLAARPGAAAGVTKQTAGVQLQSVTKSFGDVRAVDDVSLQVSRGEVLLVAWSIGVREDDVAAGWVMASSVGWRSGSSSANGMSPRRRHWRGP